jgi:hypothetical protein
MKRRIPASEKREIAMRISMTIAAMLALTTAACGGDNRNAAVANEAAVEATGNAVAALSEGQRNAVFIRAIRDAGLECQHVESSTPAGTYRARPVWRATCRGNRQWTIVIGDNNDAQILNSDEARLITDANTSANSAR